MRKALGRGLDALLPAQLPESEAAPPAAAQPLKVPISKIRPNHLQPRRYFDPEKLSELAASIKAHGLAQPIIVSRDENGNYELIAGERRLRATELAGLNEVEVVVRQPADERERLALALIENLQREDLNAVETALGYLRLSKEFGITQTQIAEQVGKSKQSISNTLQILDLPEEMQKAIQFGQLQEGHGRALLRVQDPTQRQKLFRQAIEAKLSVRDIEDKAAELNGDDVMSRPTRRRLAIAKSADTQELETLLQRRFGTKVEIRTKRNDNGKGALLIHFYSLEDFERIVQIFNK